MTTSNLKISSSTRHDGCSGWQFNKFANPNGTVKEKVVCVGDLHVGSVFCVLVRGWGPGVSNDGNNDQDDKNNDKNNGSVFWMLRLHVPDQK